MQKHKKLKYFRIILPTIVRDNLERNALFQIEWESDRFFIVAVNPLKQLMPLAFSFGSATFIIVILNIVFVFCYKEASNV